MSVNEIENNVWARSGDREFLFEPKKADVKFPVPKSISNWKNDNT